MTTLYLIRHAQAEGNVQHRFQGHTDTELSAHGALQLKYLAARFKKMPLDYIYTSPLKRAVETARAINRWNELPLVMEPSLMEINGGRFEGMKLEDIPSAFQLESAMWDERPHEFVAPMGESMRGVRDRMTRSIDRILHACNGKRVAVISHGCALRTYLCTVTGTPFEELSTMGMVAHASVTRIDFNHRFEPELIYFNSIDHLPEDDSIDIQREWHQEEADSPNRVHVVAGQLRVTNEELFVVDGHVCTPDGNLPLERSEVFIAQGHLKLHDADIFLKNEPTHKTMDSAHTVVLDEQFEEEPKQDDPGELELPDFEVELTANPPRLEAPALREKTPAVKAAAPKDTRTEPLIPEDTEDFAEALFEKIEAAGGA